MKVDLQYRLLYCNDKRHSQNSLSVQDFRSVKSPIFLRLFYSKKNFQNCQLFLKIH